jgi:hypothetical protein
MTTFVLNLSVPTFMVITMVTTKFTVSTGEIIHNLKTVTGLLITYRLHLHG